MSNLISYIKILLLTIIAITWFWVGDHVYANDDEQISVSGDITLSFRKTPSGDIQSEEKDGEFILSTKNRFDWKMLVRNEDYKKAVKISPNNGISSDKPSDTTIEVTISSTELQIKDNRLFLKDNNIEIKNNRIILEFCVSNPSSNNEPNTYVCIIERTISIKLQKPQSQLDVEGKKNITATSRKTPDGDFTNSERIYAISNVIQNSDDIHWEIESSNDWIDITPKNGVLKASRRGYRIRLSCEDLSDYNVVCVKATLNDNAQKLRTGNHTGEIIFKDVTNDKEYPYEIKLFVPGTLYIVPEEEGKRTSYNEMWFDMVKNGKSPSPISFIIKTNSSIYWESKSDKTWLNVSPIMGTINVTSKEETQKVNFSINETKIDNLDIGVHTAKITFSSDDLDEDKVLLAHLYIRQPERTVKIVDDKEIIFRGTQNDKIHPLKETIMIRNPYTKSDSIHWEVEFDTNLFKTSPIFGSLYGGETDEIVIVPTLSKLNYPIGQHKTIMKFKNAETKKIESQKTILLIVDNPKAELVVEGSDVVIEVYQGIKLNNEYIYTYSISNIKENSTGEVWSVSSNENWLSIYPEFGYLSGGESESIEITIDFDKISEFTRGQYTDSLVFTKSEGTVSSEIIGQYEITLDVLDLEGNLTISPAENYTWNLSEQSVIDPSAMIYTLTHSHFSANEIEWESTSSESWITVQPREGNLKQGESIEVSINLNDEVKNLSSGEHTADITFINSTNEHAGGGTRTIKLNIPSEGVLEVSHKDILDFSILEGSNSQSQEHILTLSNKELSSSTIEWYAYTNKNWLHISPNKGRITGGEKETVTIKITDNVIAMKHGIHEDVIIIKTNDSQEDGIEIKTKLEIYQIQGQLHIMPKEEVRFYGISGEKFDVQPHIYTFTNPIPDSNTVQWEVLSDRDWVQISHNKGELVSNTSIDITISLDTQKSELLEPGIHKTSIRVSSQVNTEVIEVILDIDKPLGFLSLNPKNDFESEYIMNTDFKTYPTEYQLSNTPANASKTHWNSITDSDWVTITPSHGDLEGGETTKVVISINPNIKFLSTGIHFSDILFTNLSNEQEYITIKAHVTIKQEQNSQPIKQERNSQPISLNTSSSLEVSPIGTQKITGFINQAFNKKQLDGIYYILSNRKHDVSNINWYVSSNEPRLDFLPNKGTIEPGGYQIVKVNIESKPSDFELGRTNNAIIFTDITNDISSNRNLTIDVQEKCVPYNPSIRFQHVMTIENENVHTSDILLENPSYSKCSLSADIKFNLPDHIKNLSPLHTKPVLNNQIDINIRNIKPGQTHTDRFKISCSKPGKYIINGEGTYWDNDNKDTSYTLNFDHTVDCNDEETLSESNQIDIGEKTITDTPEQSNSGGCISISRIPDIGMTSIVGFILLLGIRNNFKK